MATKDEPKDELTKAHAPTIDERRLAYHAAGRFLEYILRHGYVLTSNEEHSDPARLFAAFVADQEKLYGYGHNLYVSGLTGLVDGIVSGVFEAIEEREKQGEISLDDMPY